MEEDRRRVQGGEPELSVVIPTHDRAGILRQTLERLAATTLTSPWEVVVVANACTDGTVATVAELSGPSGGGSLPLRLVEEPVPSASVARNRGARAASGSLLVFLDDDILLEPDGLATILAWHEGSDRRSLLVGQITAMPEHVATPFGAFRQRAFGEVSRHLPPHPVDWYASGLAAVPAKTFEDLGGYAESYPAAGLEDADFGIRVRRAGHQIVFHPGVVGAHNDWAGTTARDFCRRTAIHTATAPLLARRFPDNDHPWASHVEVNRPPLPSDPLPVKVRKRLKAAAVAVAADRWMPALADRVAPALAPSQRDRLYRASVSVASYAGYQAGLRRLHGQTDLGPGRHAATAEERPLELSIVIVSYNCADEVVRALASLRRHPPAGGHEVIVVDNASSDGTVDRLSEQLPDVTVLALDENIGYGSAVNLAVERSSGRHLLLLNPDTETTEGAIDVLLGHARANPRAGVLGPRLLLGTGEPQSSARRLPSPLRLWVEVLRLHLLLDPVTRGRRFGGTYSAQDEPGPVDWISGACHLVPRAVWDEVGGLTERTFCGFDDLDYCWRARDAGYETLFCPDAVIVHHCGVSVSRRWTPEEVDELAIHNGYVVLEDHWPRHQVKLHCAAELAGTATDIVLGPRRHGLTGSDAGRYRSRAAKRLRLLGGLLVGRVRPIERHQPGATR